MGTLGRRTGPSVMAGCSTVESNLGLAEVSWRTRKEEEKKRVEEEEKPWKKCGRGA